MLFVIDVPEGVNPGETFGVQVPSGETFDIVCPEGCCAGSAVEVELPECSDEQLVEVVVPEGTMAGQPFYVEVDGVEVTCYVPDGCGAGDRVTIRVPEPTAPEIPDASCKSGSSTASTYVDSTSEEGSSDEDVSFRFSLPLQPQLPLGKHFNGEHVEVYRSDGTWSRASCIDYEAHGDTYTVRLSDGRCKFFVEGEELRSVPAGAFRAGQRVAVAAKGAAPWGVRGDGLCLACVEEYDEESESYTVVCDEDGRRLFYVTDDEIHR